MSGAVSWVSLCNYYHIQASKQEPPREKQLTEAVKVNEVFFIITFSKKPAVKLQESQVELQEDVLNKMSCHNNGVYTG